MPSRPSPPQPRLRYQGRQHQAHQPVLAQRTASASPSPQGMSPSELVPGRQLSPLKELATWRDRVAQAWRSLPRWRSVRDKGTGSPGAARGRAGVGPAQNQKSAQPHACQGCAKWLPSLPAPGCPPGWAWSELTAPGVGGREKSFPVLVSPDFCQALRSLRRFSPSWSPCRRHTGAAGPTSQAGKQAPGRAAEWPRRSGLRVSTRRLLGLPLLLWAALLCSSAGSWAGARPSEIVSHWATVCSVCVCTRVSPVHTHTPAARDVGHAQGPTRLSLALGVYSWMTKAGIICTWEQGRGTLTLQLYGDQLYGDGPCDESCVDTPAAITQSASQHPTLQNPAMKTREVH